jgi:hypothetical protein
MTDGRYFLPNRLLMATAAQQLGYQVHVTANVNKYAAGIEACGLRLHPCDGGTASIRCI